MFFANDSNVGKGEDIVWKHCFCYQSTPLFILQEYAKNLNTRTVAYVNMDMAVQGGLYYTQYVDVSSAGNSFETWKILKKALPVYNSDC